MYDRGVRDPAEFRVLVMRQWPRGIRKSEVNLWLKEAGPSRALLNRYNAGEIDWEAFEQGYRGEIAKERLWVLDEIRRLERENGAVRLMCFERIPPAEHCHRQVLLELLNSD